MAQPPLSKCLASPQTKQDEETNQRLYQQCIDYISTLPNVEGLVGDVYHCYDGWYAPMPSIVSTMVAQRLFRAKLSDVLLATFPKSGTTWLKSLLFATLYRDSPHYDPRRYLSTLNAHQCVPTIELDVYANNQVPDLELLPSPRLFATHVPFHSLPNSVVESGCKVVYLCRNMKDNLISLWHFISRIREKKGEEPLPLEKVFDSFCAGCNHSGPSWDHVLGYWKASLRNPDKVLFMRYEELIQNPSAQLKRLAVFVGFPFSVDEEENEVVQDIVNLCGFRNMKNLEVNKNGTRRTFVDNNMFFRRGVVGDWTNYLTPEMAQRLDELVEGKFRDYGLSHVACSFDA